MIYIQIYVFVSLVTISFALPTLYEYYTADGIYSGLSADQSYFTLNGKNISIYSGTLHYFRVPSQNWRTHLRKIRAAGLVAVETYVPWNLHEPAVGVFNFGDVNDSKFNFLDIETYLQIAQEEDLLVLIRSGPYICSEWEHGGLPSWILRSNETLIRTSEKTFIEHVTRYFNKLFSIFEKYQFTKGGPIVAFQIENEYGNTNSSTFNPDKDYIRKLVEIIRSNGIVELLYTSDDVDKGTIGTLPGEILQTINFGSNPADNFNALKEFQENKPSMVMEFWTGWFDHWGEEHHMRDNDQLRQDLIDIVTYPASFNLYLFIGGTSFGFMNGASASTNASSPYLPITNSYDYDAILAENGDYTPKYDTVQQVLSEYNPIKTQLPQKPELVPRVAYESVAVQERLVIKSIIDNSNTTVSSEQILAMERLPINNNNGQSYGYIVYRKTVNISANAVLKISGYVHDSVMVLVNGVLISKPFETRNDLDGFGFWRLKDSTLVLTNEDVWNATLDLIVENMGRTTTGAPDRFIQNKGLWEDNVYINDDVLLNWQIIPLEFKNKEQNWIQVDAFPDDIVPALYRSVIEIDSPADTYINMSDWTKGIVFVNGFALGRYFKIGPQQALYLPGQLLYNGSNEIIIFEHFKAAEVIQFTTDMIYKTDSRF